MTFSVNLKKSARNELFGSCGHSPESSFPGRPDNSCIHSGHLRGVGDEMRIEISRAEHMAWCKQRALEYVDSGDPVEAYSFHVL